MLRAPSPTPTDVSKVIYGNRTLIDLTADTVTEDTLLFGTTAHDATGKVINGQYTKPKIKLSQTVEITENGNHTILPDEGYAGMGTVIANVNVPTTPKTASGSITTSISNGTNTFTLGTVNFTPVEYGWYFSVSDGRAMAARGLSQNSYGVGASGSGSRMSYMGSVKVSANGNTITGTLYSFLAIRSVTISWWAIGGG